MLTKIVSVACPEGLHARPAAAFLKTAKKYPCAVHIRHNEEQINGKSMIALMSAGILCGEEIELICDGEQEAEALEALSAVLAE